MNDNDAVRLVQTRLRDNGFDLGAIDGIFGPRSRGALDIALPALKQTPTVPIPPPSVPVQGGGRLAVLVGHNAASQGAVRATDGRSEYDWNGDLAKMMAALSPDRIKVFKRRSVGSYPREIAIAYEAIRDWGADAVLELHFNAFSDPSANGCEMLHNGTPGSSRLAAMVQEATVKALGTKSRGTKRLSATELRGGRSVFALPGVPIIITEPYFGSNRRECMIAQERKGQLAAAQVEAALAFVADRRALNP